MIAFSDAHLFGWKPKNYFGKATLWLLHTTVWTPIRLGAMRGWKRTVERRGHFLARHLFDKVPRHGYIFGGTRHGKTSLIEGLLADVLPDCLAGRKSMFFMDSAEAIDKFLAEANLTDKQIRERVVFCDLSKPGGRNDIGCLPRLNMMETCAAAEQDDYLNLAARESVIRMAFEGVLANETSGPMDLMLGFAAQTIAYIDSPTIEDMLELLRSPLAYIADIPDLPPRVRRYWQDEIKVREKGGELVEQENETARALGRRIQHMVSRPIVERFLVNARPTIHFAERLNQGGIFLVATRKGKAMSDGARLVGRFMLSMLLRAVQARDANADHLPGLAIVDEFQDYLAKNKTDASFIDLLSQAAKKGWRLVLAHQEWGQISPALASSIIANCEVRIAGGMIESTAREMRPVLDVTMNREGPDKGKWTIDLVTLKRFHFAASVKGSKPIVITSEKDPVARIGRRLPRGKKGASMIVRTVDRVNAIMRELYADDPSAAATVQHELDAIFKEPVPI